MNAMMMSFVDLYFTFYLLTIACELLSIISFGTLFCPLLSNIFWYNSLIYEYFFISRIDHTPSVHTQHSCISQSLYVTCCKTGHNVGLGGLLLMAPRLSYVEQPNTYYVHYHVKKKKKATVVLY